MTNLRTTERTIRVNPTHIREGYRYPVSEIYGVVAQGEGMLIGRPTIFVRLGGCDYHCVWCDSLYAVEPKYRDTWQKMEAPAIAEKAASLLPPGSVMGHVTLSGGNPAIHPLEPLIRELHREGFRVGIETQGSVYPKTWSVTILDDVTLSPKPPSSGNTTPWHSQDGPTPLQEWIDGVRHSANLCLKVVVFDDEDYAYAKMVHLAYRDVPFFVQAGTDVGNASRDDLCDALSSLQDRVLADPDMQDVAALPQLHAILKGHLRGI